MGLKNPTQKTGGCLPDPEFWAGRRVLVTGHTGFKGSWLSLWLHQLGAQVAGFALPPLEDTHYQSIALGNMIASTYGDICDAEALAESMDAHRPEIVFHLAAQSLVLPALRAPAETFNTNVTGTARLLDACLQVESVQSVLVTTSDKVYRNCGTGRAYFENDPLGGSDPYSASKVACEAVINAYRDSFFREMGKQLVSLRAGNVIGGGDFSEERLIPDCIRAARAQQKVTIRNPNANRPWQHVLDCLCGYLLFAKSIAQGQVMPKALNFGPDPGTQATVLEVANSVQTALDGPGVIIKADKNSKEHHQLNIDSGRAMELLSWSPRWPVASAIDMTVDWYKASNGNSVESVRAKSLADILRYCSAFGERV